MTVLGAETWPIDYRYRKSIVKKRTLCQACVAIAAMKAPGVEQRSTRPLRLPKFADQFTYLALCKLVCLAAQCCRAIMAPKRAAASLDLRFQIASTLQAVEHRIESAWTKRIPVSGELVNHPLSIKRGFGSMMQNMESYEPLQKLLVFHFRHRQPRFPVARITSTYDSDKQRAPACPWRRMSQTRIAKI